MSLHDETGYRPPDEAVPHEGLHQLTPDRAAVAQLLEVEGAPIGAAAIRGIRATVPEAVREEVDIDLLRLAIYKTEKQRFGNNYFYTAGLTIPESVIEVRRKREDLGVGSEWDTYEVTTVPEAYDFKERKVVVAPPGYFDPNRRALLQRYWDIPTDASISYVMTYLAAHSTVHAMQQQRGEKLVMSALPQRVDEYVNSGIEQEAHRIALEITNEIWEKLANMPPGKPPKSG